MVRSTEINAAHTHNHQAKDLSLKKRVKFLLLSQPTVSAAYWRSIDYQDCTNTKT